MLIFTLTYLLHIAIPMPSRFHPGTHPRCISNKHLPSTLSRAIAHLNSTYFISPSLPSLPPPSAGWTRGRKRKSWFHRLSTSRWRWRVPLGVLQHGGKEKGTLTAVVKAENKGKEVVMSVVDRDDNGSKSTGFCSPKPVPANMIHAY